MYHVKKAEKTNSAISSRLHTADMNFALNFYLWFQDQSKHAVSFLNPKTKYLQQDVLELFNPRDVVPVRDISREQPDLKKGCRQFHDIGRISYKNCMFSGMDESS